MMTVAPGNLGLGPSCGLDGEAESVGGPRFFCADVTKLRGITFSKLLYLFSPQDVTGGSFVNLELESYFAKAEIPAAAAATLTRRREAAFGADNHLRKGSWSRCSKHVER